MDIQAARDAILLAALPHVPFDGWTWKTMRLAARDAGYDTTMARRVFPGGPLALIEHFEAYADRRLVEDLAGIDLQALRLRDRVALAVRRRLEPWTEHREAVRRAASLLSLPQNIPVALRCTYRTVDTIWHAVGDVSTDFSFYTKRALLAGVWGATVLYWLDDRSEDCRDSWAFLARRIDDVMRIPRLTARLREGFGGLPRPFRPAPVRGEGLRRRYGGARGP